MDINPSSTPNPSSSSTSITTTFLIVGGGIAGVTCLETLRFLCPDDHVTLLTESALVKTVTNLVPLGKALHRFDITETAAAESRLAADAQHVRLITGDRLAEIDSMRRSATTLAGRRIDYRMLCLCTGARPHLIPQAALHSDRVLGIRDTDSVEHFQRLVSNAKRVAIVGNGGIAAECAFALRNVHVDWVIRDRFVAQTFVDPGAAEFFRHKIEQKGKDIVGEMRAERKGPVKRMRYDETSTSGVEVRAVGANKSGAALGPDWLGKWDLGAAKTDSEEIDDERDQSINVHTNCEVRTIEKTQSTSSDHPLAVRLTNNNVLSVDLVISATGVRPSTDGFVCIDAQLNVSPIDGGILVDHLQRTSVAGIYAAGDVCTANWQPRAQHWHQMRLWTQARQMGAMAARAMAAERAGQPAEDVLQDFCFELFGHVTQLFGHQVVLLGKFNGQGLGSDYEALIRMTPGVEYIKYVLKDGRVHGAILIGETGLEETTENLILNGLDVSSYGDGLLDPNVDIEDYFD